MNGHVGDAVTGYFNFNRQEIKRTFHPIREKKINQRESPFAVVNNE